MGLKFENMKVWQKSLDMTLIVHKLTLGFPKDELYVLSSQIKRAADSVCLNIAEGSIGTSDKEFNRFMGIALKSAVEVNACLHVARKRELINNQKFKEIESANIEIIKMIQAFRNTLTAKS